MHSLDEIGPVVPENFFLKFINVFSVLRNNLLLERAWSVIRTTETPSSKDALCQVWLKLAQWFWRTRRTCEKFTTTSTTTTTTTDNGHIENRKAHLSLLIRWAKKPERICNIEVIVYL